MTDVLLGFEVGPGNEIKIPVAHMAVTGQTQNAGKTTTLEALVTRSGMRALTFITKRGEQSFASGRRIAPYFRDRADWQFVTSIIDATLQETNKFLRPWIMRICRQTHTLREVQLKVQEALATARGINEGVYTQLDEYLQLIVPEIARADLAPSLDLRAGVNVMDVSDFATPMQMLFVQSALDWVNANERDTLVVIPEAWEFIPEGKGSPVKASAIALARKGAALRNFIWVDSQDMAGVDKTILRACTVWLIGVQREANEIKRSLLNIPKGIAHPTAADIANLERGQFFACWGRHCVKTYVQPAWADSVSTQHVATGALGALATPLPSGPIHIPPPGGPNVNHAEAEALRKRNDELETMVKNQVGTIAELQKTVDTLRGMVDQRETPAPNKPTPTKANAMAGREPNADFTVSAMLDAFEQRLQDRPGILSLLRSVPVIDVKVERRTVQVDGSTTKGRIVLLLASGFYDEGATNSGTRTELKRTGSDVNNANIGRVLGELQRDGFVTLEAGDRYKAVPGMKSNIQQSNG